ncbi:hypothetical protein ACFV0O_13275 [Kitasatospora sp. NPDC059577]|uniref:hypothetical protein n=1 Tax=Kitasatospora sp. NPDC059577 TaxID=3346873 RepID=UPI0036A514C6
MGSQRQQLYDRLRGLRERAESARRAAGEQGTQTDAQSCVRRSRRPGAERFSGKRISDWAPKTSDGFNVPQSGTDDQVLALVSVWSQWAGEPWNERNWRDHLERARDEQVQERRDQLQGPTSTHGDPSPAFQGATVEQLQPSALEVHGAAVPASVVGTYPWLTPYLSREHDMVLRQVMAPALAGGPSVLVMLTGGSSTGKTRALYEALGDLAPNRPLLRPSTASDLLAIAERGLITAGAVLWLNETQRFLDAGGGEAAAARLRVLLEQQPGIVALGTMWQQPHWERLVQQGLPGDPHGQARALLKGGSTRRIQVLGELSTLDQERWSDLAQQHGDLRMTHALRAGAADGLVVQHLSGGPELLDAYVQGPDATFSHQEHALVTAALDARRLGHYMPLAADLLRDAADGALTARQRSSNPHWGLRALHTLSTGERADGSRIDVRAPLTPLVALRARSGGAALFMPADYLDQHTRAARVEQLGTRSLWAALAAHTTHPDDLDRLFEAAWRRGLYKQAIALGRKAVLAGRSRVPATLALRLDGPLDPDRRGALWIATHADTEDVGVVRELLFALRRTATEAFDLLASRVVGHTDTGNAKAVRELMALLRMVEAWPAMDELVERCGADTGLVSDPGLLGKLIEELQDSGRAATAERFADLAAAHADLTDPRAAGGLLRSARTVGADRAATVLTDRLAARARLVDPALLPHLLRDLWNAGEERAARELLARDPAGHVDITDTPALVALLDVLYAMGAVQQLAALLGRDPATRADLDDPAAVEGLWTVLRKVGAEPALSVLAHRSAEEVDINDVVAVTRLLSELCESSSKPGLDVLLSRSPAAHVDLAASDDPYEVNDLLRMLRRAGVMADVDTLARRMVADTDLEDPDEVSCVSATLREVGADRAHDALVDRVVGVLQTNGPFYQLLNLKNIGSKQTIDRVALHVAAHADLSDPEAAYLPTMLWDLDAHEALHILLARGPANHVELDGPDAVERVCELMRVLDALGHTDAAHELANRACERLDPTEAFPVAQALSVMREIGAELAAHALARRAARQSDLRWAFGTASLLDEMDELDADEAVQDLLRRDPAHQAELNTNHHHEEWSTVKSLHETLRYLGTDAAADALERRASNAGLAPPDSWSVYGRETDGLPAAPWTWDDIAIEG